MLACPREPSLKTNGSEFHIWVKEKGDWALTTLLECLVLLNLGFGRREAKLVIWATYKMTDSSPTGSSRPSVNF